jgi:hypothetical protein
LNIVSLTSARTLTLGWDPNPGTDIVGYNLYCGATSRTYTNIVSVGNVTTATVTGLGGGIRYFFAVTALNRAGLESAFSSEISYTIVNSQGTVTLTNLAQTYDGGPKKALATTVPSGLPVAIWYNGLLTPPTNAGSYTVIARITDTSYNASVTNTLVIAKGQATVILTGLTQIFDGMPKSVQVSTTPSALPVALSYNGVSAPPRNAGNSIVVAVVTDPNYKGSVTNLFVIAKGQAVVTLANLNQTFDGSPKPVQASTTPPGLPASLSYNGLSTVPTNAGSYTIVARVTDPNYGGAATNTLVIAKGQAGVTLQKLVQSYDGNPKYVSVTTSPRGLPVSVSYNGQAQAPARWGTYKVVATVSDKNYFGGATNSLTITKTRSKTPWNATPVALSSPSSPGPNLIVLSWPPNAAETVLYESADLSQWTVRTNVSGWDGRILIAPEPGPHFFKAQSKGSKGASDLPLNIHGE